MKQNNTTYLALSAAVIFWGLSFVATKLALESIPTFTLVFMRFFLGTCFFMSINFKKGFPKFTKKEHIKIFFIAFFEPGLYFLFETLGLQYTSASKASLIIATIPLFVTIFAGFILSEKMHTGSFVSIILSFIGITILVTGDPDFKWDLSGPLMGDILILGAVLSATFYIIFARNLGQSHSALEITSMQIMYGAVFFFPAFLWEYPELQCSAITGKSMLSLAYLTLFATIGAFICYNYALTKIPASRASLFINCIPVVTALGAWILLGEILTFLQTCGALLVLCAVFFSSFPISKLTSKKLGEFPA